MRCPPQVLIHNIDKEEGVQVRIGLPLGHVEAAGEPLGLALDVEEPVLEELLVLLQVATHLGDVGEGRAEDGVASDGHVRAVQLLHRVHVVGPLPSHVAQVARARDRGVVGGPLVEHQLHLAAAALLPHPLPLRDLDLARGALPGLRDREPGVEHRLAERVELVVGAVDVVAPDADAVGGGGRAPHELVLAPVVLVVLDEDAQGAQHLVLGVEAAINLLVRLLGEERGLAERGSGREQVEDGRRRRALVADDLDQHRIDVVEDVGAFD